MLLIKGFTEKTHKCVVCKQSKPNATFIEKVGYVCQDCSNKQLDYSTLNEKFVGKANKNDITFSFEFETSKNAPETLILAKYGFVPTHDGSVSGHEWKSPIYRSLGGVKTMLKNFDDLTKFMDECCGTHIHVGTLDRNLKNDIKENEHILFAPLMSRINKNRDETKKFWGRVGNSYCTTDFSHDRYQAFNTRTGSGKPTLEFRLPKFQNAEQFYNIIKFSTETTKLIKTGFEVAEKENIDKSEMSLKMAVNILNSYKKYAIK